ncbi:hypothetical protein K6W36_11500 [Acetobacter senegalensis]|nr:hypothetical protein [Acetobacter senegalensis]MCG4261191.1 hypothetical protein [Acetobacter senegalensis]
MLRQSEQPERFVEADLGEPAINFAPQKDHLLVETRFIEIDPPSLWPA